MRASTLVTARPVAQKARFRLTPSPSRRSPVGLSAASTQVRSWIVAERGEVFRWRRGRQDRPLLLEFLTPPTNDHAVFGRLAHAREAMPIFPSGKRSRGAVDFKGRGGGPPPPSPFEENFPPPARRHLRGGPRLQEEGRVGVESLTGPRANTRARKA